MGPGSWIVAGREVAELEAIEGGRPDAPAFFNDSRGLSPARLGAAIQQRAPMALGTDGRLYRYDSGVYRPDDEAFIRATTRELLGERFRARHCAEAIAWCRAVFPSLSERPPESERLNLKNGLLDPMAEELAPH